MPEIDSTDQTHNQQPQFRKLRFDLTGQRFSKLTVLKISGSSQREPLWECVCDCGKTANVRSSSLRNGHTRSCGCLHKGQNIKHGKAGSGAHTSWTAMKSRCSNPKNPKYPSYGGRGIKVCERWQSFERFLADMGERPSLDYSLDRINNGGNYEPSNCRWATKKEQQRNRRGNYLLSVKGVTKTIAEWSERSGLHHETIKRRLRSGWTPEDAVSFPPSAKKYKTRKADANP